MHSRRFVFSQVMDCLPMKAFRRGVQRYHGNRHIQSFTCLDQFLCMAFAQLTFRESLRDIEACLRAHQDKLHPSDCHSRSVFFLCQSIFQNPRRGHFSRWKCMGQETSRQ